MKLFMTRILLGTTALIAPIGAALAQATSPAIPPPWYTLDGNGVDLATGTFNYSRNDISIGPSVGGLSYGEQDGSSIWRRHSYDTSLTLGKVAGDVTAVSFGNLSDNFVFGAGGSFVSALGRGSTLVATSPGFLYTYTAQDGTIVYLKNFSSTRNQNTLYLAYQTVSPTGVVTKYNWKPSTTSDPTCGPRTGDPCIYTGVARLEGMSTNSGYGIKFDYASNLNPNDNTIDTWSSVVAATAINTVSTPGCDLTADASCSTLPGTRTVRYGTDPNTGAVTVTSPSPLNQTSRYTFDGSNRLTAIRLPASTVDDMDITYYPWGGAGAGRVYQVIRPQGTWTYSYSADYTTTTVTDPTGISGRNHIVVLNPAIARPTSDTVAGRTTSYQYDSFGRTTRVTAPQGNYVQYTYDTRGNVLQTDTVANANGGGTITTKATYNASCTALNGPNVCANKPDTVTDARSTNANPIITKYAYDPTYGVLTDVAPPTGGSPAHYGYGNVAAPGGGQIWSLQSETHSAGLPEATKTSYAYPASGNPLPTSMTTGSVDGTVAATLGYTYTSDGDVQVVSGPMSGMRTRYYYDVNRRSVGVVGPTPGANGPNGQPLKNRAVQTNFDGNGRVKSIVQGTVTNQDDGGASFVALVTQSTGYDAGGRATSSTVVAGSTTVSSTSNTYDAANRPLTTTILMQGQGPDRTTTNGYDSNGLLSTVTTAASTADASTITYGYTGNGKVASIKDGNLNMTSFAFDGFDRQQKTTYADGTFEQLGYDAASHVTSKQRRGDSVATIGYTYDAVGNLKTRTAPGLSNSYNYDTLGRLTSATGGSYNVSRTYDAFGDLLTDTIGGNGFTNHYDAVGRRTLEQMSGVAGGNAGVAIDYLTTGDLAHFYTVSQPTSTLVTFSYDDFGHETQVARAGGRTSTFTYGADQRLASISHTGSPNGTYDVTFSFGSATVPGYNPAGQIVNRITSNQAYVFTPTAPDQSYGVNNLNQLAPTPTPFTYDYRGNQTNVSNSPGATRTFDGLDRVTSASQGGTTTYLTYDALDRLAGVQAGAGAPVRYVAWNGGELGGEWNSNGGPIFYAYDNEGRPTFGANFTPNHWINDTDYLTDERGSLVGESNGTLRAYAYDAYGREAAGVQHPSLLGYAAGVALPGAGLVHFRARAYDTTAGRFVSADPSGVAGGINLYGYAGGDPVNNVDPTGLTCEGLGDCSDTRPVVGGWGASDSAPYPGPPLYDENAARCLGCWVTTIYEASDSARNTYAAAVEKWNDQVITNTLQSVQQGIAGLSQATSGLPDGFSYAAYSSTFGTTQGNNPQGGSYFGTINTDLPGGAGAAPSEFDHLASLLGVSSSSYVFGDGSRSLSVPGIGTVSIGMSFAQFNTSTGGFVQLRQYSAFGFDANNLSLPFARIDISGNTFGGQPRAETIHFGGPFRP